MAKAYIGNKKKKEFHRVKSVKPDCNFDKITPKNRVEFDRGRDAIKAGYDPCFKCNRYFDSKR